MSYLFYFFVAIAVLAPALFVLSFWLNVKGARLTGEATPVHFGRRTMVWQTRINAENGRLVALTTQTQLIL